MAAPGELPGFVLDPTAPSAANFTPQWSPAPSSALPSSALPLDISGQLASYSPLGPKRPISNALRGTTGAAAAPQFTESMSVSGEPPLTPFELAAEPIAPPKGPAVAQAAVRVAQAREVGLPSDLIPKWGTYYGPNYEDRVQQAQAAGSITPQQAQSALGNYQRYLNETPLGVQEQMVRAKTEAEQELGDLEVEKAEATEQLSQREAAAMAEIERQKAQDFANFEAQDAEIKAEMVRRSKEMDALKADIASTKISPENYWSNQPAWAKILSLLSVGIGGFASGWSGGRIPNMALEQLNQAIDRDIDAQKTNLSTKKGALAESQNLYGLAVKRLGTSQQAYEFSRARMLDKAADVAARFRLEGRTEQIRQGAEEYETKLRAAAKDADLQVQKMHLDDMLRRQEEARRRAASGAGAAKSAEERERARLIKEQKEVLGLRKMEAETVKAEREAAGEGGDRSTIVFNGVKYSVPKELAKETAEMASSAQATQALVDSVVTMEGAGYANPFSEQSGAFNVAKGTLTANLAKVYSGGFNPSAEMESKAAESIPDPFFTRSSKFQKQVQAIPDIAKQQVLKRLQTIGAREIGAVGAPVKTYEKP